MPGFEHPIDRSAYITALIAVMVLTLFGSHAEAQKKWTESEVRQRAQKNKAGGWDKDNETFGLCTWACDSNEDPYRLRCFLGRGIQNGEPISLEEVSLKAWMKAGIIPIQSGASIKVHGGLRLEVSSSFERKDRECRWRVSALGQNGIYARLIGSRSECITKVRPKIYLAPGGRNAAVFTKYISDHGCGELSGWVWTLPEGAARAFHIAGKRLHQKQKARRSIAYYQYAYALDEGFHTALFNEARAHAQLGQVDRALALVKKLIRIDRALYLKKVDDDSDFKNLRRDERFLDFVRQKP